MRVEFNGFVFDSVTHELRRGEQVLRVSRKAFRLLEVLIEHRPAVVPQQELYDAIWPGTFVDVAGLHNLVSQLRSALGDGAREIIRTVHGVGFAFGVETQSRDSAEAPSAWELTAGERTFLLPTGALLVGRTADAAVHIASPMVSRRHAILHVTASSVLVEDLGSKNGTFVNGARIAGKVAVTPCDELRFGQLRVLLTVDEATRSETHEPGDRG